MVNTGFSGPIEVGFFLFKFYAYALGQKILEDCGSGHNYGNSDIKSIPIWEKFPNLNFCFRSKSELSKNSSLIGIPLYMDHSTATRTRIAFARICIDVNVDSPLPDEVFITYNDKTIVQRVEYAWRPSPCTKCSTFSHSDKACPLKLKIKQVQG